MERQAQRRTVVDGDGIRHCKVMHDPLRVADANVTDVRGEPCDRVDWRPHDATRIPLRGRVDRRLAVGRRVHLSAD